MLVCWHLLVILATRATGLRVGSLLQSGLQALWNAEPNKARDFDEAEIVELPVLNGGVPRMVRLFPSGPPFSRFSGPASWTCLRPNCLNVRNSIHSLRLTWKLPEGVCKWNQVFQKGPGSFHVSLGGGGIFLKHQGNQSRVYQNKGCELSRLSSNRPLPRLSLKGRTARAMWLLMVAKSMSHPRSETIVETIAFVGIYRGIQSFQ